MAAVPASRVRRLEHQPHGRSRLATATINDMGAGRLQITLKVVAHVRMYEVQSKTDAGSWTNAGLFNSTRQMVVTELTPGTNYTFQVRALGGSMGQSEWGNPLSHMSM